MHASSEGHLECVKDLLDKSAEVNMQDKVSVVLVGPFWMNIYPDVRPPCVKIVVL